MSKYSKDDIIRMVEEEDVEFIRLQFTDIFGMLKNVAITAGQLPKLVFRSPAVFLFPVACLFPAACLFPVACLFPAACLFLPVLFLPVLLVLPDPMVLLHDCLLHI